MDADFVVLDDGGSFSHCANAAQLLANFEYPDEAACIIDRAGNYRRLMLDKDRNLALGPVRGPVEFAWLLEQWIQSQRLLPGECRIRRFRPTSMAALLADLFEILGPDMQMAPGAGARRNLAVDPYGHSYRVISQAGHQRRRGAKAAAWYVEVNRG